MKNYDAQVSYLRYTLDLIHRKPEHWSEECSTAQVDGLRSLLNAGLHDRSRKMRLKVVSELLGYPIVTTKTLLKWEAHTLIEFLKEPGEAWRVSQQGRTLIEGAEYRVSQELEKLSHERTQDRTLSPALPHLPQALDSRSGD